MSDVPTTRPLLIALVWCAGLGAAAQFGKIALAIHEFRDMYPVGEVWLGFLISCVGTVGLILGVVGGAVLGRIGIRRAFLLGLVSAAVLSALQALQPPFAVMIALRICEGVSHLALVVAGPILMARYSSDKARPAVMTLWSSFFGVSFMLLAFIAPPVLSAFGVTGFLLGHALCMATLALLAYVALPSANTAPSHTAIDLRFGALLALHGKIYTSPWLSAAALGFVCYTILYISLLAYIPDFAMTSQRVWLTAAMPLVSIVTSLTFGVWLLSRMSAVRAVQIGFALTGLSALALLATAGTAAYAWTALVVLGATGFIPGASFAALTELNPEDENRALATGAIAQMGNVGTTSGPPLLAALIAFGGQAAIALFVLVFCGLGILIHALQHRRRQHR